MVDCQSQVTGYKNPINFFFYCGPELYQNNSTSMLIISRNEKRIMNHLFEIDFK